MSEYLNILIIISGVPVNQWKLTCLSNTDVLIQYAFRKSTPDAVTTLTKSLENFRENNNNKKYSGFVRIFDVT